MTGMLLEKENLRILKILNWTFLKKNIINFFYN